MNLRIIGVLVSKDISLFFRNRFFALMTLLGIATYLALYFVMPRTVDESLEIGLYARAMPRSSKRSRWKACAWRGLTRRRRW